jgi:hypothetical protein
LAQEGKVIKDILFNCPKQGFEVHLKVKGELKKGLFGTKFTEQELKKCDLHSQGGCTVKLEPVVSSTCPAIIKAQKSALK